MKYEDTNLRIREHSKGWVVEIEKSKWTIFGIKKYWVHFISYSGLSEQPFYYSTFDSCLEDLLREIKYELIQKYKP